MNWIRSYQSRFISDNQYAIKIPYLKKNDYKTHPKFYKDYEKVQHKIDETEDSNDIKDLDDLLFNLKYVLDKLEKLLSEKEFNILLMRFSIYHIRYPKSDKDYLIDSEWK